MKLLEHGDFREGVRALLVDKDRSPNWAFKAIREVDIDWMGKCCPVKGQHSGPRPKPGSGASLLRRPGRP